MKSSVVVYNNVGLTGRGIVDSRELVAIFIISTTLLMCGSGGHLCLWRASVSSSVEWE